MQKNTYGLLDIRTVDPLMDLRGLLIEISVFLRLLPALLLQLQRLYHSNSNLSQGKKIDGKNRFGRIHISNKGCSTQSLLAHYEIFLINQSNLPTKCREELAWKLDILMPGRLSPELEDNPVGDGVQHRVYRGPLSKKMAANRGIL